MNNFCKILTRNELIKLGFVEEPDENEHSKKHNWSIKNNAFLLILSTFGDITLIRQNADSEGLTLQVNDLFELECIVDWMVKQKRC